MLHVTHAEDLLPNLQLRAASAPARQPFASPLCPKIARFSNDQEVTRRACSGYYHPEMVLHGKKWGALVTASDEEGLLAWILFYREESGSDFTDEEMRFLTQFQEHFEAAAYRMHLQEASGGLPNGSSSISAPSGNRRDPEPHVASTTEADSTGLEKLTEREREVFDYLIQDLDFEEIAHILYITVNTLGTHRTHIFKKLGVTSRMELIGYARRHHIAPP